MTSDAAKSAPKPRPPAGLGGAGKALWRALTAEYLFNPSELAVLNLACRQADDVAALERTVAADGMTVEGSAGQPRLNAAVTEVRQGRLALGKLLGALAIPDESDRPRTAASERGRRAAETRWRREGVSGGVA